MYTLYYVYDKEKYKIQFLIFIPIKWHDSIIKNLLICGIFHSPSVAIFEFNAFLKITVL